MAYISETLANSILDEVLNGVEYSPPSTLYVALFDGDPLDAGVEVSGASYARQSISFNSAASQEVTSAADVQFPEATEDWGQITHTAIMNAETAGDVLFSGSLTNNRNVYSGDIVRLLAGEVVVVI